MIKAITLAITTACSLTLLGCAAPAAAPTDRAMLTFETKPSGATLYEGKTVLGIAPQTRTYMTGGKPSIETPEVTAVWPSGAKATFWTNMAPGDDRVATLTRPESAPNLQLDQANADKVDTEKKLARSQDEQMRIEEVQKSHSADCVNKTAACYAPH